jgi:hypothetical protein
MPGIIVISACFAGCAATPEHSVSSLPDELHQGDVFTLYGDRSVMSDTDFEAALDVLRKDTVRRYGSQSSISRVYVIDRNHMKVRYWPRWPRDTVDAWAQLEREGGRWRISR